MTGFIVDNSVWQRSRHNQAVIFALETLIDESDPDQIYVCDIQVAELGFSAQNLADHDQLTKQLARFNDCPVTPTTAEVLSLQRKLWAGGLLRAVGAADTVIAAYALANAADVVHYDHDFDHVAAVEPRFSHHWILPRGSI